MRRPLYLALAFAALATCLLVPVLYFTGAMDAAAFRQSFLLASIGWFVFAALWSRRRPART